MRLSQYTDMEMHQHIYNIVRVVVNVPDAPTLAVLYGSPQSHLSSPSLSKYTLYVPEVKPLPVIVTIVPEGPSSGSKVNEGDGGGTEANTNGNTKNIERMSMLIMAIDIIFLVF
ncbi:MAG: hypothetical protein QXD82_04160 [Nitrososphaerales archaeon]